MELMQRFPIPNTRRKQTERFPDGHFFGMLVLNIRNVARDCVWTD